MPQVEARSLGQAGRGAYLDALCPAHNKSCGKNSYRPHARKSRLVQSHALCAVCAAMPANPLGWLPGHRMTLAWQHHNTSSGSKGGSYAWSTCMRVHSNHLA